MAACHRHAPAAAPVPAPVRPPARTEPAPFAIVSAPTLVRAMRERYASEWYHTVTFSQRTTLTGPSGGQFVQTWYEAAALPGRLRIDTDLPSKSGVIYAKDSLYRFNAGKLVGADTGLNPLLILGFDVYAQPAARSEAALRRLGFDLTRFHETTWNGTPVYVVGAWAGDTASRQFWVERDRLLFVRMLEHTAQGRTEFRFEDYVPAGKGWVAARVEELVNGRRRLLEQYSNIRVGVPLSDALFEPKAWTTAPHWMGTPGSPPRS